MERKIKMGVIINKTSKSCKYATMSSVGIDHIVHGVGAIIMVLIVEAMVVHEICTADVGVWVAVAFIMQIAAVYFGNYAFKYLAPIARKVEFQAYFSRLEDVVDISHISEHYSVMLIDNYGVVFADTQNQKAIEDWLLVNKGSSTRRIEKLMFTASE